MALYNSSLSLSSVCCSFLPAAPLSLLKMASVWLKSFLWGFFRSLWLHGRISHTSPPMSGHFEGGLLEKQIVPFLCTAPWLFPSLQITLHPLCQDLRLVSVIVFLHHSIQRGSRKRRIHQRPGLLKKLKSFSFFPFLLRTAAGDCLAFEQMWSTWFGWRKSVNGQRASVG